MHIRSGDGLSGIFPAYAGVSLSYSVYFTVIVHIPRVCGGEPSGAVTASPGMIYSPRMRG